MEYKFEAKVGGPKNYSNPPFTLPLRRVEEKYEKECIESVVVRSVLAYAEG